MTTTPDGDRLKIYVNTNITMSRGKMAAHVAHAALTAAGVHPDVPVVVLGAKPRDIAEMTTVIHDHGKTELEPGTLTAGTDYIFESQKRRQQAIGELLQLAAEVNDPFIAARVSSALELLTVDTAPPEPEPWTLDTIVHPWGHTPEHRANLDKANDAARKASEPAG